MKSLYYILFGTVLGAIIGFLIPYLSFHDSSESRAFAVLFTIFTVPLGSVFGMAFGYILSLLVPENRPFSKRLVKLNFEKLLTSADIELYYKGLKKGFDSGKEEEIEGIEGLGIYDGAKIKAYGNTKLILSERIKSFEVEN